MSLAADLARAFDPVALARSVGMEPDGWQAAMLRSRSSRILLNCARQAGKSTVTAILGVHEALYVPESLVILLAPSQRQSTELFLKAKAAYRGSGRIVQAETENQLSIVLENGSRIVALPGKESTVRGYSGAALLVIDEAARVPDDLYFAVRPMLAVSAGRIVALSTPFGARGWFYDEWHSSEPWERYEVPAADCPRIPAEFLDEESRRLGEWWYRQEYLCEFLDAETAAFRREDIEAAISEEVDWWTL